jgi:hypothetical protein
VQEGAVVDRTRFISVSEIARVARLSVQEQIEERARIRRITTWMEEQEGDDEQGGDDERE